MKAELRGSIPAQPAVGGLMLGPALELILEDVPEQIQPELGPSGQDPAGIGVSAPPDQPGLALNPGPGFAGSCRPKELDTKL